MWIFQFPSRSDSAFDSGGALNVMLNLFGLDIFVWIKRKKHFIFKVLHDFKVVVWVATLQPWRFWYATTWRPIFWLLPGLHSVWVGAGVLQNSLVFCCWKNTLAFSCVLWSKVICDGHKSSTRELYIPIVTIPVGLMINHESHVLICFDHCNVDITLHG